MTSMEWLIDQLEKKGDMRETPAIRNLQFNIDTSEYLELKRQAKEMHYKEMQKVYYEDRLTADVEISEEVGWEFKKYYEKEFLTKT